MPSFGGNTHVFVIRAWLEPREIPGAPPEWRFSVEHLGSEGRRYLRELEGVTAFLQEHLPETHRSSRWWQQLQRLLHQQGGE
jgi:hypothetical protein